MKQSVAADLDEEAALYREVHREGLHDHLRTLEASYALAQWLTRAEGGRLPDAAAFRHRHLDWLRPDAILLGVRPGGRLVYEHYGSRIRSHTGFDMTGREVVAFQGVFGRFVLGCYREVLAQGRPLVTVHRLGQYQERPLWERIILPLATDGRLSTLYVIARVLDLGREFNAFEARGRGHGLLALQFARSRDGTIVDGIIVGANLRAREMTGRRMDELLHRSIKSCFPGIVPMGLWDRYRVVAETRQPQQFVIDYESDGLSGTFVVEVAPFLDGVSIEFAGLGSPPAPDGA